MDISKKSIGFLIDELITTSMKCWFAQEVVMQEDDDTKVADAARKAQRMNARRNLLIAEIDKRAGDNSASPSEKTYA